MKPIRICLIKQGKQVFELYADPVPDMVPGARKVLDEMGLTLENIVEKRCADLEAQGIRFFSDFVSGPQDGDYLDLMRASFQLGHGDFKEFFLSRLDFVGKSRSDAVTELGYKDLSALSKLFARGRLFYSGSERTKKLARLLDVPVDFLRIYGHKPEEELGFEEFSKLSLGQRLRYIRELKSLDQREAGLLLGILRYKVYYYETADDLTYYKGFCVPDFAKAYDVPVIVLAPFDEFEYPEDSGACIAKRRNELRMSQRELARRVKKRLDFDISYAFIRRVESGTCSNEHVLREIVSILFERCPDEFVENRFGFL